MARIRLNQEYRNKIGTRMRVHLEAEDTQEKKAYDDLKADQIEINDNAWTLAKQIVRRHYTEDDIVKARYLQDKFENVDTIQPDSCFHFHYMGEEEERDYDNNVKIVPATIEKHFDFRLNGSTDVENNSSHTSDSEYGYALLRDELKAQEGCNPDILIDIENLFPRLSAIGRTINLAVRVRLVAKLCVCHDPTHTVVDELEFNANAKYQK